MNINRVPSALQPLVNTGNWTPTSTWFRFFEALANLQTDVDDGSISGGFVPTLIAAGESFTVPENRQALFHMPIENNGTLVVDGYLIEV